jgi:hypothetical protein
MNQTDDIPNPLVLQTLGRAFTTVGKQRGIDEWVQIGKDLNQSAEELVTKAAPPEQATAGPQRRGADA